MRPLGIKHLDFQFCFAGKCCQRLQTRGEDQNWFASTNCLKRFPTNRRNITTQKRSLVFGISHDLFGFFLPKGLLGLCSMGTLSLTLLTPPPIKETTIPGKP